ncbi:MAG: fatty acid desaturase family protein [Gammaproteobacteria bacterium]|nr:fatty acid desaturase family protein [Gammaproteobacteria bacterium]
MSASAAIDRRSLLALLLEWAVIIITIYLALRIGTWWSAVAAFVIVSTRQHALLILYHDAVHGHFARDARVNDFMVNLFVGIPAMLPVEVYRPLHIDHHRELGTDRDPERQLLYVNQAWNYQPLPFGALLRQLLGDLLIVNGARTIAAWRKSRPFPPMSAQTMIIAAAWIIALGLLIYAQPAVAMIALALWILPLLTLTQLLQKLRSYAEHSGGPGVTPGWQDWTYSWRPGLLGRMTIWPYNINRHREHHQQPGLAWHHLPSVAADRACLAGSSLWQLLAAQRDHPR